ncbi:hypothetical protein L1887_36186 [Cichorium endivia]|nr:hypothetical protein L1887_36186 [Cichorium endivia]
MTLSKGLTSHAHLHRRCHSSDYKYSSSPSLSLTIKHITDSIIPTKMKLQSATALILLALLFTSSVIESSITTSPTGAPVPSPSGSFGCDKKCELRCSRSGWRKMCLKLCGICCGKCKGCVPSGPYANKAQCPCYRDMKNKKGKDKCP